MIKFESSKTIVWVWLKCVWKDGVGQGRNDVKNQIKRRKWNWNDSHIHYSGWEREFNMIINEEGMKISMKPYTGTVFWGKSNQEYT